MQKLIATHLPRPNPPQNPERTLLKHLPLVRFLALRIHGRLPRNVDFDDLYSAGVVGLIEAFAKFDPAKNVLFTTFAQFRIRGAILDSLRLLDWAPRDLRYKGRLIQQAIRKLASLLGHAPLEEEIADEMKISLKSYQQLLGDVTSLEIGTLMRKEGEGSSEEELMDCPTRPEDDSLFRCLQGEMESRVIGAIEALPARERLVTRLYYYEAMTMSEISLKLRVNRSRVSQIHASAILHLRSGLSDFRPRGGKPFPRLPRCGAGTPKLPPSHREQLYVR
jgi:RNA polymerase sigma factor FliA